MPTVGGDSVRAWGGEVYLALVERVEHGTGIRRSNGWKHGF